MHAPSELSNHQLRYFGGSLALSLVAFAALARWKWQSPATAVALLAIALFLATIYYAVPATRRPTYRVFRAITYPVQLIMTAVILAAVFFGILTPIGLVLRLRGINLRKKAKAADSHWTAKGEPAAPSSYFNTY